MNSLAETMERIRAERLRLRSFPTFEKEEYGNNIKNDNSSIADISNNGNCDGNGHSSNNGDDNDICKSKKLEDIDRLLSELKKNEPGSDDQFFRLSIIAYEIGDLHRSIVYANRFKDDKKIKIAHLAHGKLALADVLTQLYLLCLSLEWDFNQLRELGVLHLQERHEDFKRDGWSEVK